MVKNVYTTNEVGNFCGVDLTTVINWIKQGKMKAYKTVGGHRRIKRSDIRAFMKKYSMPIPSDLKRTIKMNRILIVDDDPSILAFVSLAIKKLSDEYIIATAADGFEAGNKLATFKPDIIVLDIQLPGIDGYKIIEKIKKLKNGEKILAITAYNSEKIKEKILNAGADGFLPKPFSSDEFLSVLQRVQV